MTIPKTGEATEFENWKEFYPDAEEQLPDNMPTPYGKKARITVYVDADHAHNVVTRRNCNGETSIHPGEWRGFNTSG
jgi:hypothetical protein